MTTLKPHQSPAEAASRLIESGGHAAPVVDDEEHVLGIVSTSDIMQGFLRGPPRRGVLPKVRIAQPPSEETNEEPAYHRRPTDEEYVTAMRPAEMLHVELRGPRSLGKTMLYLDQRRRHLERVLELADRFLVTGQDEPVHALLLKAILAAKRIEEHAAGTARVPFPLE